jgi:hypothetical protein
MRRPNPHHHRNAARQQEHSNAHEHRYAQATTAIQLDEWCKRGCSDPHCTAAPEDHEEIYITPACHPNVKNIGAFYDRITKEVCFVCPVCEKGIIKVGVK